MVEWYGQGTSASSESREEDKLSEGMVEQLDGHHVNDGAHAACAINGVRRSDLASFTAVGMRWERCGERYFLVRLDSDGV